MLQKHDTKMYQKVMRLLLLRQIKEIHNHIIKKIFKNHQQNLKLKPKIKYDL